MSTHLPFPEPDYIDLIGVGRADLVKLADLRRRAEDGDTTLAFWRRRYDGLLRRYQEARETSADVLDSWHRQAAALAVGRPGADTPAGWAGLPAEERKSKAMGLLKDLEALAPPPEPVDLPRLLNDTVERQESMRRHSPEMDDAFAEIKGRLHRWMAEDDGRPRDPWSGLVLDLIEQHRRLDDDALGAFPVSFRVATAEAWLAADPEERRLAAGVAQEPEKSETDWKASVAFASPAGAVLRDFLSWLATCDDPSARTVTREWSEGPLRDLVATYLDDHGS